MAFESIASISASKAAFSESVPDSFGMSISESVFSAAEKRGAEILQAHEEAAAKQAMISAMLAEIRAIV